MYYLYPAFFNNILLWLVNGFRTEFNKLKLYNVQDKADNRKYPDPIRTEQN